MTHQPCEIAAIAAIAHPHLPFVDVYVTHSEKYARSLGAGDFYKLFAFILTMRPLTNDNVGLSKRVTRSDWMQVKKDWDETNPAISRFLEGLDRELLLVLRTDNILRSINVALGGEVNRYYVAARSAIKVAPGSVHIRSSLTSRFLFSGNPFSAHVRHAWRKLVEALVVSLGSDASRVGALCR